MHRAAIPMFLSFLAVAIAGNAGAQSSRINTSDVLKIKHVNAIDVAPDATFAIYVVRSIVENDDGFTYRNDLWSINLLDDAAEPIRLTSGDTGGSSPAISPDSNTLAFVRAGQEKLDGDAKPQIWLLSLHSPGEARQLTTLEHGVSSPRWHPDGSHLFVTSSIPESEIEGTPNFDHERANRQWRDTDPNDDDHDDDNTDADASPSGDRASIRRWLASNAQEKNPSVITRLNFLGEHDLADEPRYAQIFTIDADSGESTQLTDGFTNHRQVRLSPDATSLVYTSNPPGNQHPDRGEQSSIYLYNLAQEQSTVLLDDPARSFNSPHFADDGTSLVFGFSDQPDGPARWGAQARIGHHDFTSGQMTPLTAAESSHARAINIDNNAVYFTSPREGSSPLFSMTVGPQHETLAVTRGVLGVQSFDVESGTVVASITTASNPSELYRIDTNGQLTQLTTHNEQWLRDKSLSTPTEHWVERPDGTRVQFWVMEPTNKQDGTRYPTVLEIHGGPSAMWGPGERSMWHEFQLLASWGYGVVYSNPRGSSGYGYQFQHDNYQDWGHGPTGDVLAALDAAVERYDWIDHEQLVVTGGSYAGYLTAWIVTQDHRFNAAVAQRGVYDLDVFFGEGNAWRLDPWAMGGYPWDDAADVLERESPFTYVDQINTPLLIMHASSDLRTGVTQSEMMYRALKVLERPVEYVRYPDAGHDLSRGGDPTQRMDRLNRIVEFFERFVNNDRPAPVDISADTNEED